VLPWVMARDAFHNAVRRALEKDGWTITDDPLKLEFGSTKMLVDLGAEKLVAATRDQEQIAIEIKSFLGTSEINEFHTALGQYLNYRQLLRLLDPTRKLYLAVPLDTYNSFFSEEFPMMIVQEYAMMIVVYDQLEEEIVTWR
jgi:XisH protein